MNKTILTIIAMFAITLFSMTSIVAKDKVEKDGKKDCKKECGKALNNCNTETSKIDKTKEKQITINAKKNLLTANPLVNYFSSREISFFRLINITLLLLNAEKQGITLESVFDFISRKIETDLQVQLKYLPTEF